MRCCADRHANTRPGLNCEWKPVALTGAATTATRRRVAALLPAAAGPAVGPGIVFRGVEVGEEFLHVLSATGGAGRAGDVTVAQEKLVHLTAGAAAEIVKRHIASPSFKKTGLS